MSKMYLILKIEYDGTNYSGWQRQNNAATIQGEIEKAFREITGLDTVFMGAGRTDAGVHAREQIAHTQLSGELNITQEQLPFAINSRLNYDIRVKSAILRDEKFHARFDAIAREYIYTIVTDYSVFTRHFCTHVRYPLDIEKLCESAGIFLRKTDFTTFSKINSDIINNICDVSISRWIQVSDTMFSYRIKSNHFLYGMVRALVGTMLDISRGKRTVEEAINALEAKNRALQSPLAPPNGLVLEKIYYKNLIL